MGQMAAGISGFAAGFIVAGGVVALMVGLGIITRFIGITHTACHIKLYENMILLGAVWGNILTVYRMEILQKGMKMIAFFFSFSQWCYVVLGNILLLISGLCMGMFVGGWIMALSEVINVFPVYCRRFGIKRNLSWIVIALAGGKLTGNLIFFYMRWGQG